MAEADNESSVSIPESLPENKSPSKTSQNRFLGIPIAEDITKLNFVACLISALFSITFFVFLNAELTFVLSDRLGITDSNGTTSGDLAFYDELLSIFMVAIWGTISDKVGRRPVNVAGYFIVGIALFVFPLANNVYPQLLLARLLFSIGAASCSSMITALVVDSAGRSQGAVSGIVGLFTGAGALIGVFGLVPLPSTFSAQSMPIADAILRTFYVAGGLAIAVGILLFFLLKNDKTKGLRKWVKGEVVSPKEGPTQDLLGFFQLFWRGIKAAKDPRIALAYASGFVARADTIILTLFMSVWINQYYIDTKECTLASAYATSDLIKSQCRTAFTITSTITGIAQACALIGALIVGFAADRINRSIIIFISALIGIASYFTLGYTADPTSAAVNGYAALVGISEIGMIVGSLSLISGPYVDPRTRGSIAGVYSMCGAVGILLISKLGGELFDNWMRGAPFIIMGIMHIIVAVIALFCFIFNFKNGSGWRGNYRKDPIL